MCKATVQINYPEQEPQPTKYYIISLDPAQLNDYSALAVLECSELDNTYRLVSLARRQHQPYTEIVAWAKKVFLNPKFNDIKDVSTRPIFVLDVGGVGRAIKDMLTAEGIQSVGIQLTGGESVSRNGDTYHVSKSFVIGKFLAAWDEGRVKVPSNASFWPLFEKELKAFRGEMSAMGRAKFEAAQGEHDDLVMAVAQAVWYGEQNPVEYEGWQPDPFVGAGEAFEGPFV